MINENLNYYSILGLKFFESDPVRIKSAWRTQLKKFHPDNCSFNNYSQEFALSRTRLINESYAVLSSPQDKSAYDGLFITLPF